MTGEADRLDSLDVFRGITIAAMILVSTPGTWTAVYTPLDHALWNGWTLTDLVFPFLLFAMGAAVPFALARRRGTASGVGVHIVRRALILFALGLVLNAIEAVPPMHWATFRIPGVLQRIAIVFVAVAWLTERGSLRLQIATVVAVLAGYWAALSLIPVPHVGAGVLTPEGNLASFIDRALLGRHLLNPGPGTRNPLFDPEGLLSTLPAIATAMAGVFAGDWLKERRLAHHSAWLFAAGLLATVAGLAWGRVFPINKNLWTSSFALFSGGLAAQALALLHWLIDVRGWRAWSRPFAAYGRNPLAAYFLSVGCDSLLTRVRLTDGSLKGLIYRNAFVPWLRPCCGAEAASLGYAIAYVVLWGVILGEMYRRRIFIRI
jgi:predicted acyltransferase